MTFLYLDPREERQTQQQTLLTPSDPKGLEPGLFDNALGAAGTGVGRVFAVTGQLLGEAEYSLGSFITRPLDEIFDTKMTDWMELNLRQAPRRLTASMVPDPVTTGTIGNILYSLIGIGTPAVAGTMLGGPAVGAAAGGLFQGTGTYTDLTAQGVDPLTATGAAALDATLTGVGVGLPGAVGRNVAFNTFVFGPGINVAQDLVAGQSIGAVLESRGYTELASRYSTIHGEMIAADIILGGVFGYTGSRANNPRPTVANRVEAADVAMTAAAVKHAEIDTAPGLLADVASLQQHTRNLQNATEAVLDGRPVQVDPLDGPMAPKPENPVYGPEEVVRALRESGVAEILDEVDSLEAALQRRGLELTDEPLPDVPQEARRPEQAADVPPEPEAAPERAVAQEGVAEVEPESVPLQRQETRNGDTTTHTFSFGGREIGYIEVDDAGRVVDSRLDDKLRGQRLGVAMYENLLKTMAARGVKLTSDGSVTEGAARAWRSLGRRYEVVQNPTAKLREGNVWLTDDGSPVFTTTGKAKAKPDPAAGAGTKAAKLEPGEAGMQARASDVVDMDPDLIVVDENGVARPAADALDEADAAVARAQQDAPGFDAAVSCFIGSST